MIQPAASHPTDADLTGGAHKSGQLLKLKAASGDDLKILSMCLQDALVPIASLRYETDTAQFLLIAHRFCWEKSMQGSGVPLPNGANAHFHRTHTMVTFSNILSVRKNGFAPGKNRSALLNLLALDVNEAGSEKIITLHFSGRAQVELVVGDIACHLTDLHAGWQTASKPMHV